MGSSWLQKKGLAKDPELAQKIDRAIFPGLQGGPHDHTTAGIAIALYEAEKPEFKIYAAQIVKNAKVLAEELMKNGFKLVSDGTDNHMMLIDLTKEGKGRGGFLQEALDVVGISLNKNTIPADPSSPFHPSGVRLGTPSVTTRGMKEAEMITIAGWIQQVYAEIKHFQLPEEKDARNKMFKEFRTFIKKNEKLKVLREETRPFCLKFPVPGIKI